MIGSYLKTATRNILRHKLFATINIIGLAIGLAVGLLVITLIHDLFSYDRFHQNRNRIYRITTSQQKAQQGTQDYASASVKVGQICQQQMTGIEDVAILRKGFRGDVTAGQRTLPVSGLWATPSFLSIFTFPLLKGDPLTALKEPYSLVITQKQAQKLFGPIDPLNQLVRLDSTNYKVTGVLQDVPLFSHLQFEALISWSTFQKAHQNDPAFFSWDNLADTYVYLLLPKNGEASVVQRQLDQLDQVENAAIKTQPLINHLQPLPTIFLGKDLRDEIGHSLPLSTLWALLAFALIAILTACFNYTNLSIARSLRRAREVGVRKVLGAVKGQVLAQFIVEAIVTALLAMVLAFELFLGLRSAFLALGPSFATLKLSPSVLLAFGLLTILVGVLVGLVPAMSLAKINPLQVLKNLQSLTLFRHVTLRKVLIFSQYTFSLFFVAATLILYQQYQYFTHQDVGFQTKNILNIALQNQSAAGLKQKLLQIPQVQQISQSQRITSLGATYQTYLRYKDPQDSLVAKLNGVDQPYLPLHHYKLLAGQNFHSAPRDSASNEIVINLTLMKQFNLGNGDPQKAIGSLLTAGGKAYQVVGVLSDFHYNSLYEKMEPAFFRYAPNETNYLNVKVASGQEIAALARIREVWKQVDSVHPLMASWYKDDIEEFYHPLSVISKLIGSLAFLTIFIASLGLFGMVVYTTETRLKEISIRKVLGASELSTLYLLSKGFVVLLGWAAVVALVATYFLVDRVLFPQLANHASLPIVDLLVCMLVCLAVALLIISSQTIGATRANPARVLKAD